jgi:uncharacterized protein (TIGR02145 family)
MEDVMNRLMKFLSFMLRYFWLIIVWTLLLVGCSGESEGIVIDIDGNEYKTVKIGRQWWMADNLIVKHYRNGDALPNAADPDEWCNLTSGAYSIVKDDPYNIPIYGLHYNWYAATDPRGICPAGWHVPTDQDWMALEKYLGLSQEDQERYGWRGTNEGGRLKDPNPGIWATPLVEASDDLGFSARPGGGRTSDCIYLGSFLYQTEHLAMWSTDEYSDERGIFRVIEHDQPGIKRDYYNKGNGFSIRCVKD